MDALVLFSFILTAMLILCANLIYFTERGKMGLNEAEFTAMDVRSHVSMKAMSMIP